LTRGSSPVGHRDLTAGLGVYFAGHLHNPVTEIFPCPSSDHFLLLRYFLQLRKTG